MKRFLLGLFVFLFIPLNSLSQDFSIRGNVGASFVRSPDVLSNLYYSGTSFGFEGNARLYDGVLLVGRVGYPRFSLNENFASSLSTEGGGKAGDLSFLSFSVGLKYEYINKSDATPYVVFGWGKYQERFTDVKEFSSDGSITKTGENKKRWGEAYYISIGSDFEIADRYFIFIEPRYVFYDLEERRSRGWRYFVVRLGFGLNF